MFGLPFCTVWTEKTPRNLYCKSHTTRWAQPGARPRQAAGLTSRTASPGRRQGAASTSAGCLPSLKPRTCQYAVQEPPRPRGPRSSPRRRSLAWNHSASPITPAVDLVARSAPPSQWREARRVRERGGLTNGFPDLFAAGARTSSRTPAIDGHNGWDVEYPRDILGPPAHRLPGLTLSPGKHPRARPARTLRFDRLTQPWLRTPGQNAWARAATECGELRPGHRAERSCSALTAVQHILAESAPEVHALQSILTAAPARTLTWHGWPTQTIGRGREGGMPSTAPGVFFPRRSASNELGPEPAPPDHRGCSSPRRPCPLARPGLTRHVAEPIMAQVESTGQPSTSGPNPRGPA